MPISAQCPRCNQTVSIPDQVAGKRVKCPHCQQEFLAPGLSRSSNDDDDWLSLEEPPTPTRPGSSEESTPTKPTSSLPISQAPPEKVDTSFLDQLAEEPDEFTTVVESPPPPRQPLAIPVEYASEFRVKCKVCDSLMFAKASQAGKTVKCSDCLSPITIPQPPKVSKKPKMDIDSAQTFTLAQPKSTRNPDADPHRKSAAKLLEDAARVDEEPSEIRYADTPSVAAWLNGIFGIFRDLGVVTHWIGLSLIATVPILLVIAVNHPYLYAMLLPGCLFFSALVVSCGFAILQSVANGEERVSEWPILDPPTWLGELVVAIAAAAIVAAPVAALSHILVNPLIGIAFTMFAIYGFFPFVLLSMMDMNSVFAPFSPEVARSVTKCQEAWGGFYFTSGILFAALFLLIVTVHSMGSVGIAISVFASVGVTFIYFAMIGRLAFAIGQAVNAPPKRRDSESTSSNDS